MLYEEAGNTLENIAVELAAIGRDSSNEHDSYVIAAIKEAIAAAEEGNFGVGAVLVDPDGTIVERGHNHVFHPHFRSDIHAEMDVMDKFEDNNHEVESVRGYTLYTSLEPCPMCLTRLITSGVSTVFHAADDTESGLANNIDRLTPVWIQLANDQTFALAPASAQLADLALDVFLVTAERNTERLMQRRR